MNEQSTFFDIAHAGCDARGRSGLCFRKLNGGRSLPAAALHKQLHIRVRVRACVVSPMHPTTQEGCAPVELEPRSRRRKALDGRPKKFDRTRRPPARLIWRRARHPSTCLLERFIVLLSRRWRSMMTTKSRRSRLQQLHQCRLQWQQLQSDHCHQRRCSKSHRRRPRPRPRPLQRRQIGRPRATRPRRPPRRR